MSGFMSIFVNLRIGTKLAITSLLSVLLVAAMVGMQMINNGSVSQANNHAIEQVTITALALDTKASVRGLQIGLRDLRLAGTSEDIKKAQDYIGARLNSIKGFEQELVKLIKTPENRERIQKLHVLAEQYVAGSQEVAAVQATGVEVRKAANGADISAKLADISDRVAKIAREKTLPIAAEMEDMANKIVDVAKARSAAESAAAVQTMSSAEHIGLVIGIGVALILIGATVFAMFTIARPMKALTRGMLELADGNFDVVLPGLGRTDEIGDVAQAVEIFKVKSAEKARTEAQANADRELKIAAEKAERDRIVAEEKLESDQQAAAERDAATARIMAEFDAAVGGIAKAAMSGDFSQRVPLEGKEGVIRNLAGAMNSMCDNIGKVMDDLVAMMGSLAEGDLTKRINASYEGTFGTLKDSANATASRLSETISEIKASAKEVSNAAAEISTSTTDLSQRTEEQAAGLEETSASMEEISATVKKNAENAQQANNLTAGARDVADRGGQVVAKAVDAMSRIEDSSSKIADIIGVIDEIARQTNLLALNAAVEAARAGDAGRGFAVVASEVRSLAQRSSQAAKDIKDLITNSTTQVKDGVDLVNRAGQSLTEILASIKSVADIVADIATASNEQATGIDQVNKALTQMDEVTQQNSALVEENAATAKTLESQSAAMNDQVSKFVVEGAAQVRIATAAPAQLKSVAARALAARPAAKRGPVGRMQSQLATAIKQDSWQEF
jgi:methyl-accepting chemotaxis protein